MRLLVTGACGFIGTNLCLSLLEDGHLVTGVDSLTNNYPIALKKANMKDLQAFSNFKFINQDLLFGDLDPIIDQMEVIFHLAGHPSVHNSWGTDFQSYTDRNIVLTQRLLNAAMKARTGRFVYSSSSSVYGKASSTPTKESDQKLPVSPYGVTKLAAENLVTLFGSELGLSTISLRYFTVYGPRQRPDMAFSKLINASLCGETFQLHGEGSQIRDFTYVADVVNANKLAATLYPTSGSVFNIGGGAPISMIDAIELIEGITKHKIRFETLKLGPGNPMITRADCSAAENLLGWRPETSLLHGLESQVEWQKQKL